MPMMTSAKPHTPRLEASSQGSGFFLGSNSDSSDDYDSEIETESQNFHSETQ